MRFFMLSALSDILERLRDAEKTILTVCVADELYANRKPCAIHIGEPCRNAHRAVAGERSRNREKVVEIHREGILHLAYPERRR